MAQFGSPSVFFRGRWENIRVTGVGKDEETPLIVREGLVNLIVPTVFTIESLKQQSGAKFPTISPGSRLAYITDVFDVLNVSGKQEAAEQLRLAVRGDPNFSMYAVEPEIYELVK